MLKAWRDFIVEVDPDILTGYNILNFDIPYLLDRADALGVKEFPKMCRIVDHPTKIKKSTFSSKAYGTRETNQINILNTIVTYYVNLIATGSISLSICIFKYKSCFFF